VARVSGYPTAHNEKALRKSAVQISRKAGTTGLTPVVSHWLDCPDKWADALTLWAELPYADWQDCPDLWADAAQLWDYVPSIATTAYVRKARSIYNGPAGAYTRTAESTRRAAAAWRTLTANDQASWNSAAIDYNTAAYHPIIDPRTGAPRFATQRRWTGFTLFASEYHRSGNASPLTPQDSANTGQPDMTELLTGNDYEQRIIATLGTTDGNLTIIMYQVSPQWANNALQASPLFDVLKNQPMKRSNCRIVMGTPTTGTNLASNNAQAAADLAAQGWQVRQMPQYPVLHAKLWLIERGYVYAGSHNLSNRATTSNHEAGILTTANAAVSRARIWTQEIWDAAV
jgi:PLD-like domain